MILWENNQTNANYGISTMITVTSKANVMVKNAKGLF